jgi:glycosyltransferase involved in cell wall biosynthesis
VAPEESAAEWQPRLIEHLIDSAATHLITHIESDPGHIDGTWHWDALWAALAERWDGVLLGVMFDSAFQWIQAKGRYLGQMSPRFVAVDICMPMDGIMVKGRPEVGPVNMPVSQQSLALLDQRLEDVHPGHDVSFIGTLYPHRVEMLEAIRAAGAKVVVNPHRPDQTLTFAESRANQPSWLDYMAGLASSRMTINFSRSSAGPVEQLKTRVLEATLAGTLLLTDDVDRTGRFFVPEQEYGYFATPEDLPEVVARWLKDPQRLDTARLAGQVRARELARESFLGGIQSGLLRRGLPLLGQP